jgi:hypothetical protein
MAPKDQSFDNNGHEWNIRLEDTGELTFKANGKNGNGETRMRIEKNLGQVRIGGSGKFGQLQLLNDGNEIDAVVGSVADETAMLLGGKDDRFGHVELRNRSDRTTVNMDASQGLIELSNANAVPSVQLNGDKGELILGVEGNDGNLQITDSGGKKAVVADGQSRKLQLLDSSEKEVIVMDAERKSLALHDGFLAVKDSANRNRVTCDGGTGAITCNLLSEVPPPPVPPGLNGIVSPLTDALDRVLAVRVVRYQRDQIGESPAVPGSEVPQIGFGCQELEAACPELVTTDAAGQKSINYSRMTAVLVEAVKEQQQQIRELATALRGVSERLSLAGHGAGQPI